MQYKQFWYSTEKISHLMNVASNCKEGHAASAVSIKHRTAPASAAPLAKSMCEVKQLFLQLGLHWGGAGDTSVGR